MDAQTLVAAAPKAQASGQQLALAPAAGGARLLLPGEDRTVQSKR